MAIIVTQGHEKGIGLEVFLKSFLLLPITIKNKCILICSKNTLSDNLLNLNIPHHIKSNIVTIGRTTLKCHFIDSHTTSETLGCLEQALIKINSDDILFTLPSSKDQFGNNKEHLGHTEFLRKKFTNSSLAMTFYGPSLCISLLTDHIPLNKVSTTLTQDYVFHKIENLINTKWFLERGFENIIFAGINPHAGESGLMGKDDESIHLAVQELQKKYSKLQFTGPLAGDSLLLNKELSKTLFVYAYHDQGLSVFKSLNQTIGVHCTLGLPFLRLSVDHGTAFDLYGKNKADYAGCLYSLQLAAHWSS